MKTDPTFWLLARASGLTAYVLLTDVRRSPGLTVKSKPLGPRDPGRVGHRHAQVPRAARRSARSQSHGLALTLDQTVHMPVAALLVPGLSPYRPLAAGLGVLGAELMLLVYVSFSLRRRIGARAWRRLHYVTFAVFAVATVHGLAAGTDRWAFGLYAGSVAAVAGLTAWRVITKAEVRPRSAPTYRIQIDRSLCSGFGSCVDVAPGRVRPRRRRHRDRPRGRPRRRRARGRAELPDGRDHRRRDRGTGGCMRVLIVGAGLAGARCAEILRAEGFDGPVTLVGEEPVAPYERPALSKELLAGTREAESLALRPAASWAEKGIELLTGTRIARIDGWTAVTDDGRVLPWDALVVATGVVARRLAPGRHRLRTLADATALREALAAEGRLTVVGTGLVGTEAASTARSLGVDVTLVGDPPLERHLGAEVAHLLAERHREHGVRLAPRETVPCDPVVLDAVGARPETGWLRGLVPLRPDGSVVADACGRTPIPRVYACGDVTGTGHWTAAAGQAAAVAHAILGRERPYDDVPYFWSDQLGLRLQAVGDTRTAAAVELDGDLDSLRARYTDRDGCLVAALLVNRPGEVAELRRELASSRWDLVAA